MGLFGFKSKKDKIIDVLIQDSAKKSKRIKDLEKLSDIKDSDLKELMSDALRHGSSLGGKHMADRKKSLKVK